jgi:hypothetical protein
VRLKKLVHALCVSPNEGVFGLLSASLNRNKQVRADGVMNQTEAQQNGTFALLKQKNKVAQMAIRKHGKRRQTKAEGGGACMG